MLIDFEEIKHKLNNSKWYGTQAWYEMLDIISDCDDKSRPKGRWIGDRYCSSCDWDKEDFEHIGGWKENFCPCCGLEIKEGTQ